MPVRGAGAGVRKGMAMSEAGSPAVGVSVGELMRDARRARRLTLEQLAERVGCSKSYLSAVENSRCGPPCDALLRRIEEALFLKAETLVRAAGWETATPAIRRELGTLRQDRAAAQRLAELLAGSLDDAYRSGELRRLIERLSPASPEPVALPFEVPLINRVAAGYPREFTDLGYPARVADEYVRCPDLADPDAFAARVVGDSMLPDYREGDVVVFSPARSVRSGADCFARIEPDHETTFKRVYLETDAAGRELIRLQPLNPSYPPRVVAREDVAGLYPAVSVMRSIV